MGAFHVFQVKGWDDIKNPDLLYLFFQLLLLLVALIMHFVINWKLIASLIVSFY